jgi:hypothetical protein
LSEAHQLPRVKGSHWLFEGPTGVAFARPWFDRWTSRVLAKKLFPLSRLWVAAMVSDGDVERFRDEAQVSRLDSDEWGLAHSLMRDTCDALSAKYKAADEWESHYFQSERPDGGLLVTVEVARRAAASHFLAQRFKFRPLTRGREIGAVRFEPPSLADMEEVYGDWMD